MSAIRIQRKRTKGWRMPEGTIYVGRPTMWGNPWKIGSWTSTLSRKVRTVEEAVSLYREWVDPHHSAWVRKSLRGKNLACFCPLDQPCHADVLLQIANAEPPA